MKITTMSGTQYYIDGNEIRRLSDKSLRDLRNGLAIKNDPDEWREVIILEAPEVGRSFRFQDREWDGVITTPVVEILDDGNPIYTLQDMLDAGELDVPNRT